MFALLPDTCLISPKSCAGNTGQLSPANCGTPLRRCMKTDSTITIAGFLNDKDLVLKRQ
jgi:hypothetical protein